MFLFLVGCCLSLFCFVLFLRILASIEPALGFVNLQTSELFPVCSEENSLTCETDFDGGGERDYFS